MLAVLSCSPKPPPPPPIVVVVPTAPVTAAAPPEEAAPVSCPAEMILLAGGVMRSGDRSVSLSDYCLDQHEVTAGEYEECVRRGLCDDDGLTCDEAFTYKKPELSDHPINCVSWKQANRYCRAAGKHLPTRDEWEWAAQGRTQARRFAWGDGEPTSSMLCWGRASGNLGTCPVSTHPASKTPEGVDDLFGNVWEWLSPPERDGIPNVARGASWHNDSVDTLEGLNAGGFTAGFERNDVVGFRCALGG